VSLFKLKTFIKIQIVTFFSFLSQLFEEVVLSIFTTELKVLVLFETLLVFNKGFYEGYFKQSRSFMYQYHFTSHCFK